MYSLRKICMMVLVLALVTSLCACGTDSNEGSKSGNETTAVEKTTAEGQSIERPEIVYAYEPHSADTLDTTLPFWKYLQDKLNIKLTFMSLGTEGADEKRNVFLASNQYFDIMTTTSSIANLYGNAGIFMKMDEFIDQYKLTNLDILHDKATTNCYRDEKNDLYLVPRYWEDNTCYSMGLLYSTRILKELGVTEPETMDEWYNVFKSVKEKYPEVIPFSFWKAQASDTMFASSWDMAIMYPNWGGHWGMIGSKMSENKIQLLANTDNYKQMLMYFNKLYTEGLLDKEYITLDQQQFLDRVGAGKVFMTSTSSGRIRWYNDLSAKAGEAFEYMFAKVATSTSGKKQYFKDTNPWMDQGTSISAKTKNSEAVAKFINYCYSEEGTLDLFWGIEGVDYKIDNGKYKNIHTGDSSRLESGWAENIARKNKLDTIYGDLSKPDGLWEVKEAYDLNNQFLVTVPRLKALSNAKSQELNKLITDADTFIGQEKDKFITGKTSFDQWDAYCKQLESFNTARITELLQEMYDSYLKNN